MSQPQGAEPSTARPFAMNQLVPEPTRSLPHLMSRRLDIYGTHIVIAEI